MAFAQATPFVLALKFVLDIEPIKRMPALAFEVRRVAAGILATRGSEGGIEYARLVNSAGSSLLAGKSVPTLATIGKYIAIKLLTRGRGSCEEGLHPVHPAPEAAWQ